MDSICLEYMKKYDGAEFLDINTGLVRTKIGLTTANNLSTGLKTLIVVRTLKQRGITNMPVFVGSCGENVLVDVFKEADNTGITLILRHSSVPEIDGMKFEVNHRKVTASEEEWSLHRVLIEETDAGGVIRA